MGSKEWLEAAEMAEAQKRRPEEEAKEIEMAARSLESFLNGPEGEAGKRLLKAADRYIPIGELLASPGRAVTCHLDGDGLKKSIHAGAYENKQPDVSLATAEEAVKAFKLYQPHGRPKHAEIIGHIYFELEKISEEYKKK